MRLLSKTGKLPLKYSLNCKFKVQFHVHINFAWLLKGSCRLLEDENFTFYTN